MATPAQHPTREHSDVYRIFARNATESPGAVAVIDDKSDLEITYGELLGAATRLAMRLIEAIPVVYEEPIRILMGRCVEQLVAQLAIIQLNGCCVPIDPELPATRRDVMLNGLGVRLLLTADGNDPSNIRIEVRNTTAPQRARCSSESTSLDQCTHILHTSGTTGPPKAVELPARGLVRHTCNHAVTMAPGDRAAHMSVPFFDVSLFEVWGAFLSGATLVVLPPETVRDPHLLQSAFKRHRIDVAAITTSLFNVVSLSSPTAFHSLRTLLVGGEAANARAVERVLHVAPPTFSLINAYGPTECSTFALVHRVSLEDTKSGRIPIGREYDAGTTFRIISQSGQDAKGVEKGELYIGGEGVARGYRNQPELTAEKFVWLDGMRWYRTGDQVYWQDGKVGGILEFCGRLDSQVKLRGFRFELEEVENAILASGFAGAAAATLVLVDDVVPFLAAFVVPNDIALPPEKLDLYLWNHLPAYMIPRIRLLQQLPLTANGRIDRKQLVDMVLADSRSSRSADKVENHDAMSILKRSWEVVLAAPEIGLDDDFFDAGGTSISASIVAHRFNMASQRELPVSAIYEHRTIRRLVDFLEANTDSSSVVQTMLADSKLADEVSPAPTVESLSNGAGKRGGKVFLTGATGFLGAYLLAELLKDQEVETIFCLVRAPNEAVALTRIQHALQRYLLWDPNVPTDGKLLPLSGFLEEPNFGLSAEQFSRVALESDTIYHLGAQVNYVEPYSSHRPANVIGTLNIIHLAASSPPKTLHFVSTISAFGPVGLMHPNTYLPEDASLHPYLDNMEYYMGYAQSQWVAEEMVRRAMERGIRASVYRPGHISGDTRRGIGNNEDFVARLVHGSRTVGAWPKLPNQSKNFVPVDYVVAVLLRISKSTATTGKCYNIVPPEDDKPSHIDMADLLCVLQRLGCDMVELPYKEWVTRIEESRDAMRNRLYPLLPMLAPVVHKGLSSWELHENMPVFSTRNTEWAVGLSGSGPIPFPALDDAYFGRCLAVWNQQ